MEVITPSSESSHNFFYLQSIELPNKIITDMEKNNNARNWMNQDRINNSLSNPFLNRKWSQISTNSPTQTMLENIEEFKQYVLPSDQYIYPDVADTISDIDRTQLQYQSTVMPSSFNYSSQGNQVIDYLLSSNDGPSAIELKVIDQLRNSRIPKNTSIAFPEWTRGPNHLSQDDLTPLLDLEEPTDGITMPSSVDLKKKKKYSLELKPYVDVALERLQSSIASEKKKSSRKGCTYPDCTSRARAHQRCKKHGGSTVCTYEGCDKNSQSRGLCIAHGGGPRCRIDGCERSSQSKGLCKTHGQSQICTYEGCTKKAHLRKRCRSHGGGRKCLIENCFNWAQRRGWCMAHSREFLDKKKQA